VFCNHGISTDSAVDPDMAASRYLPNSTGNSSKAFRDGVRTAAHSWKRTSTTAAISSPLLVMTDSNHGSDTKDNSSTGSLSATSLNTVCKSSVDAELKPNAGPGESGLVAALKQDLVQMSNLADSVNQPTVPALLDDHDPPKRKKSKKSGKRSRKPSQEVSSDANRAITISSMPKSGVENVPDKVSHEASKSNPMIKGHTEAASVASHHSIPSNAGTHELGDRIISENSPSGKSITCGAYISPTILAREKSNQSRNLQQSKVASGDEKLDKTIPKASQSTQKPEISSAGSVDPSCSARALAQTPSPTKKKPNSQRHNGRPTPGGTAQIRHKRGSSERKLDNINRKENNPLSGACDTALSDPSQWPALGSCKPTLEIKTSNILASTSNTKVFGDKTPQPGPTRRGSMASVVSSSPHLVRRAT
jgi:hypothetical protein